MQKSCQISIFQLGGFEDLRKMLQNEDALAKIGTDTAGDGPKFANMWIRNLIRCKQKLAKFENEDEVSRRKRRKARKKKKNQKGKRK